MMKIAFGSDLHLEMDADHFNIRDMPDADLLVLAGDIVAVHSLNEAIRHPCCSVHTSMVKVMQAIAEKYKDIVWVFGNHEFWDDQFHSAVGHAQTCLDLLGIKNIHILDNTSQDFGAVSIFGSTFWTSCDQANPLIMLQIQQLMKDFKRITIACPHNRRFTAQDWVDAHAVAVAALQLFVASSDKTKIIVTHHAMSFASVSASRYSPISHFAYASHLDHLLSDPSITGAIHGHIHENRNYMMGHCNVLAAPRGYYGFEPAAHGYRFQTMDV